MTGLQRYIYSCLGKVCESLSAPVKISIIGRKYRRVLFILKGLVGKSIRRYPEIKFHFCFYNKCYIILFVKIPLLIKEGIKCL